jgi:hypothetical protein
MLPSMNATSKCMQRFAKEPQATYGNYIDKGKEGPIYLTLYDALYRKPCSTNGKYEYCNVLQCSVV